jgi:hypothetical protein
MMQLKRLKLADSLSGLKEYLFHLCYVIVENKSCLFSETEEIKECLASELFAALSPLL